MKTGTVVYRVVEFDPHADGPHTWKVWARVVERASTRQIKLKGTFPGFGRVTFKPEAFGHHFFATPLQAIQHFLIERRMAVESLDRQRKEVERAIAWCYSQEGVTVP